MHYQVFNEDFRHKLFFNMNNGYHECLYILIGISEHFNGPGIVLNYQNKIQIGSYPPIESYIISSPPPPTHKIHSPQIQKFIISILIGCYATETQSYSEFYHYAQCNQFRFYYYPFFD